ncbi:D-3-phosphoglycerate dehydrogenase [Salisediminibacterium halotolerans]|nr:D-3-phosphoglycerate dehydrogenase [Actinophytocola xinjiangensis]RPE88681.1 D-3-phosphoglycerate dehydrogenase [Salisediminibacterium halotolerans]TWG36958.1 D-3-phosphoglycerate dehydrogenase [Salisediminibacterium halotolerans]GEL08429.1 D-3-phosphoglycerate dehydrogenase [Salisediminibacterium halotolerans]
MEVKEAVKSENQLFTVLVSDQMSEKGLQPVMESDVVEVVRENIHSTATPLAEVDALLIRSATTVTKELIEQMPNLKIIGRAGVGVDNVDLDAATENGVVVVNAPDGNTISTAEHTFAMLASLVRNIPQANQSMKEGKWDRKSYQGTELYGKTLGVIGFGRIGAELAARARAFRMNVIAYDPFLTQSRAEKNRVTPVELDELLASSDFISLHTPLTKETKGMINAERINQMKNGVYILNCARGGIIDEDDLYNAIENGPVQGAAVDVYEDEPADNHPLTKLPQVITTPHIAASTTEAQTNVAEQVAIEVLGYLNGKPAPHALNLPYLDADVFEKLSPITKLTRMLGDMSSQLFREPVKAIKISYAGELSHQDTGLFNRSFLAGFFRHRIDAYVNEVNASHVAKDREINVSETHETESSGYSNFIEIEISGEKRTLKISGTYSNEFGPRVIKINEFALDFQPSHHTLYVQHNDRPGVIGKVGQLLGKHDVNIAAMQVGRSFEGGNAIMLLGTDKECDQEVLKAFAEFEEIVSVSSIEL